MLSADGSGTACFSACRRIPLADRRRKRLGSSFGSETTLTSSSPNDTIHYAIAAGQDDGVDSNGLLVVFPGCRVVGGSTNPCNYNESTMRSDLLLWQKVGVDDDRAAGSQRLQ